MRGTRWSWDLCTVNVDIRLTPALDDRAAAALLQEAAASTDAAWPGTLFHQRRSHHPVASQCPARRLAAARRTTHRGDPGRAHPRGQGRRTVQHRQLPRRAGASRLLPPDSAWTTRICTAPTSAFASIPYQPFRPPTIKHSSPFCMPSDLPQQDCCGSEKQPRPVQAFGPPRES